MSLAERLTRLCDVLVALSGSPIPTHLFQTLADLAPAAVPCDYLAVCLPTPDQPGYLVHSLAPLPTDIGARAVAAATRGCRAQPCAPARRWWSTDLAAAGGPRPLEDILAEGGPPRRAGGAGPARRGGLGRAPLRQPDARRVRPDDVQVAALIAAGLGSALESARAYQALADERSTLAAVLGSTSDAVVMLNDDGIVLLANPAVGPMLGLLPDAMVGRPLLEVPGHEPLRQLFEQPGPRTVELPLPDGRTAQASLVSVVTPYGEPVGVAAVLRDITLLKHLDQMKNDFVNTVSHDLKNPISVIEGTAEVISLEGDGSRPPAARPAHPRRGAVHGRARHGPPRPRQDRGRARARPRSGSTSSRLVADAVRKIAPSAEAKGVAMESRLPAGGVGDGRRRRGSRRSC